VLGHGCLSQDDRLQFADAIRSLLRGRFQGRNQSTREFLRFVVYLLAWQGAFMLSVCRLPRRWGLSRWKQVPRWPVGERAFRLLARLLRQPASTASIVMQVHSRRVIAMQRVATQSKLVVTARCTTMGPYRSLGSGRSIWLGGFFLFCFLAASETRALVRASCWTGSLLWGKGGGGGGV
jgi:hypothetical protein